MKPPLLLLLLLLYSPSFSVAQDTLPAENPSHHMV